MWPYSSISIMGLGSLDSIPIVILAAGLSTRFPGNKLLYVVDGKPLIRHIVESALKSKADEVVVVVGHDAEKVSQQISDLDVIIVYNPNYRVGMSESVKKGLKAVYRWASAVIIHPADVAFVAPSIFNKVIEKYLETKAPIVVAAYKGRRGHPILFSNKVFKDIFNISEKTMGLKYVTKKYADSTVIVETNSIEVITDIDTIEDLKVLGKA